MDMEAEAFASRYAAMSEQDLYGQAHGYDSLIEPAQAALRAEFAKRGMEAPLVDDDDESRSRKLVTLRRYRDLTEAIVARGMLESAGIAVYLRDENMIRLDWQLSNFIGGIRLQVDAADADAAMALLEQPVPESIAFDSEDAFTAPRCPRCGSPEVRSQAAHLGRAIATTFVFGVPTPVGRSISVCNACEARWEDIGEDSA